jgi:hypothetical protein
MLKVEHLLTQPSSLLAFALGVTRHLPHRAKWPAPAPTRVGAKTNALKGATK